MALAAIALVYLASLTYFQSLDQETARNRLSLYQRSLNDTIRRFQHLPFVLARDGFIQHGLNANDNLDLSRRLSEFAKEAELEAIYLMNPKGLVVASSNYNLSPSFLGQNYGFRPYFKEALSGNRGSFFGVGATTGRPGYFISEPVRDKPGNILGVIAVKLDVSELQNGWEAGGENVFVTNPDGIVVLASSQIWRYRLLYDLDGDRLEEIRRSKQFGSLKLKSISWSELDSSEVRFAGKTYPYAIAPTAFLDWQIHYLLKDARAYERAILATTMFGSMIALLMFGAVYLRSKRIQTALTASQSDRKQLVIANRQLENAQAELARSSKLAALGQLSASVVHELGQPISALRNYLTAEEITLEKSSLPTLRKLDGVVHRMENITKQLRFFTRPGDERIGLVAIDDIISGCLEITRHDIEAQGIELEIVVQPSRMAVMGNRLRLEQVLTNLIKNSLAALREANNNNLMISAFATQDKVMIRVRDNGVGFADRSLNEMSEPFHTTRASGDGMGLGLSIATAIIKEHEGSLTAINVPTGGAEFNICLPIPEPDNGHINGS